MTIITGTAGNDVIAGTTSADEIYGGDGNDTITGGAGNDVIYGGKGTDTVSYAGAYGNFKLTALYEGKNNDFSGYTVADLNGSEGIDTVSSDVEYLTFSSGTVVYKIDSGTLSLVGSTSPSIAVTTSNTALTKSETATITFTLSESSTNFSVSDVTVTGGALSNFSGSGKSYTALFTPTVNSTSNGVVSIASGVFTDALGSTNADGSDSNNTVTMSVNTVTSTSVIGTSSADSLTNSPGSETIDGGAGADVLTVSAAISNYTLTKTTSGYTLVDKIGSNGTDTLLNIEAIKFSDKTINLTVQAKAASAPSADVTRLVELYTAFFNRVPDADGMSFWIDEMKAGKTTNQVAEAFYNAGVNYSSLTGFSSSMTNADFINVIYKNVLGRKDGADAGGLSFWETEITSGRATRGTLVTDILDSAHTFKGNATWGWVADLLDNKIAVAKKFSIDMGLNYNTPEESITKGMAIASAITPTDTTAAITLIGVTEANLHLT